MKSKTNRKRKSSLLPLKEIFSYDKNSGTFLNLIDRSATAFKGEVAGCRNKDGYIVIGINGKIYKASNLAWFFENGYFPLMLDHINGDRSDNRISNLRECTPRTNAQNLKIHREGKKLVGTIKRGKRFYSRIKVRGESRNLGSFRTEIQAHEAYLKYIKRWNLK